ncbi:MAG TPA: signal recognition particle-docking protein FtsY [Caldimonas sp.]|jgi:fused signal recognition particle receptor|nr:signal recognition particle-docking protein FtsY [Caldimonas sp.]HEX4233185.1 signal recognition particle-docking protein FtsY [Caldimonas sp.]
MFSFFKKKPSSGATVPTPAATSAMDSGPGSAASATGSAAPPDSDRQRGALGWLNADVGELFFGKRPTEAAPASGPEAAPATPRPTVPPLSELALPLPVEDSAAERAGWLAKLKTGLQRTGSTIASAFIGAEIGDALYEDLEGALLQADAGADATLYLLEQLQARVNRTHVRDAAAARRLLATLVEELLQPLERPLVVGEHTPTVIMVVGVNGAGKTTSIGKLARHLLDSQQNVLLAAADTFRAAAREQLLAWAERAGTGGGAASRGAGRIEIVSQEGGDPAGVTFDAVVAGKARGCDVVIVDTAGRLATQAHLMEELKKMKRVIGKAEPGAPHEVLLVIDGNTGQNALAQVQAFDEALQLTGLVITKLDGTAKGGVLAAIALWSRSRAEPLPVYFLGVGEKLADLQTFRAREFAAALVG